MAPRLPEKERSAVVLVGTSKYQSGDLPNINSIENNLADLAAALTNPRTGGFDPESCVIFANPADWREVYKGIQAVCRKTYDTVLIYFSGHGKVVRPRNELFLCTAESDIDAIPATALPYNYVRDLVLDSPAANKIVILDCCFAGRAAEQETLAAPGEIATQAEINGSYLLTAVDSNVLAVAPEDLRNTAFTGALLETMATGAEVQSKFLTLSALYRQTRVRLERSALPRPIQHGSETIGDLALGLNPQAYGIRSWTRVLAPIPPERQTELRTAAHAYIASVDEGSAESRRRLESVDSVGDKEVRRVGSAQTRLWGSDDGWNGRLLDRARGELRAAATDLTARPARSWRERRLKDRSGSGASDLAHRTSSRLFGAQDSIRKDCAVLETELSNLDGAASALHEYWMLLHLLSEMAENGKSDEMAALVPLVSQRRSVLDKTLGQAVAWGDAMRTAVAGLRQVIKQLEEIADTVQSAAGSLDADKTVREAVAHRVQGEVDRLVAVEADLAAVIGGRPAVKQ